MQINMKFYIKICEYGKFFVTLHRKMQMIRYE